MCATCGANQYYTADCTAKSSSACGDRATCCVTSPNVGVVGFVAGSATQIGAKGRCAKCTGNTFSATGLDDVSCCQAHKVCDSSQYVSAAGTSRTNAVCAAKNSNGAAIDKAVAVAETVTETATEKTVTTASPSYDIIGYLIFATIPTPDDFTADMKTSIKETLATKCGVSAIAVTLVVTTASHHLLSSGVGVDVAYTVQVDSMATAEPGKAALAAVSAGGDTAMRSFVTDLKANAPDGSFAFAAVESITVAMPVVKNTTMTGGDNDRAPAPSPGSTNVSANGSITGAVTGAIVGGVMVIAIVVAALLCLPHVSPSTGRVAPAREGTPRVSSKTGVSPNAFTTSRHTSRRREMYR